MLYDTVYVTMSCCTGCQYDGQPFFFSLCLSSTGRVRVHICNKEKKKKRNKLSHGVGERVEWSGPVKRRTGWMYNSWAWGGERGAQRAGHKKDATTLRRKKSATLDGLWKHVAIMLSLSLSLSTVRTMYSNSVTHRLHGTVYIPTWYGNVICCWDRAEKNYSFGRAILFEAGPGSWWGGHMYSTLCQRNYKVKRE